MGFYFLLQSAVGNRQRLTCSFDNSCVRLCVLVLKQGISLPVQTHQAHLWIFLVELFHRISKWSLRLKAVKHLLCFFDSASSVASDFLFFPGAKKINFETQTSKFKTTKPRKTCSGFSKLHSYCVSHGLYQKMLAACLVVTETAQLVATGDRDPNMKLVSHLFSVHGFKGSKIHLLVKMCSSGPRVVVRLYLSIYSNELYSNELPNKSISFRA